jgi:hypothetical protein
MKKTAFVGSLLLLAVACGRAAPEASAPRAPADEAAPSSLAGAAQQQVEPQTLAEAEALLEKAKSELDRLALNEPEVPPATAAAAPPAPAPAAPTRAEGARPAEKAAAAGAAGSGEKKGAQEASPCETACKAFSSLERASDAVCRLDTEAPAKRCERARQIKDDAARRVSSCACR